MSTQSRVVAEPAGKTRQNRPQSGKGSNSPLSPEARHALPGQRLQRTVQHQQHWAPLWFLTAAAAAAAGLGPLPLLCSSCCCRDGPAAGGPHAGCGGGAPGGGRGQVATRPAAAGRWAGSAGLHHAQPAAKSTQLPSCMTALQCLANQSNPTGCAVFLFGRQHAQLAPVRACCSSTRPCKPAHTWALT